MLPLFAATLFQVSVEEFTFSFDGKESGYNRIIEATSGQFESVSELDLQGVHISSKLKYTLKAEKVVAFEFDEKIIQGTKTIRAAAMSFKDGKALIKGQDGAKDRSFDIKPFGRFFATFHLGGLKGLQVPGSKQGEAKSSGERALSIFFLEQLTPITTVFSQSPAGKFQFDGKEQDATLFSMKIGAVDATIGFDKDNQLLGWEVPTQKIRFERIGAKNVFLDRMSKFPELSQSTMETVSEEVEIPMRDGVATKATVFRPKKAGKYPTILARTPYGRGAASGDANGYAKRGYVYIVQDVRGTGDSKGTFKPMEAEQKDGYDTLDWISKQSWSDGGAGMTGGSYVGFVQWAAAVTFHPALKCIVPQVSPPSSAMWNIPYENGTLLMMSDLWWLKIVDDPKGSGLENAMKPLTGLKKLTTLPLSDLDNKFLGFNSKIWDTWLTKEGESKWPGWSFDNLMPKVKVPALHISGWFDGDEIGTQRNWQLVRSGGNDRQWLIYGPWTHFFNTTSTLQDLDFGKDAILELDSLYLRWFDTWLKGKEVGLEKVPRVKFFVTGANRWVETTDWPAPNSVESSFEFDLKARKLVQKVSADTASTYTYDPRKERVASDKMEVSPSVGTVFTPEKELKKASVYLSSDTIAEDVTLTGPMSIEFDFQSSALDTDFYANVFVVDEKGKAYPAFRGGKLRAAFVGGLEKPVALVPGQSYRARLTLWDAAHRVKKGHRLVITLVSSLFPSTARNLGTMEPIATGTKMVVQKNTILSSPSSPAVFRFRILPQ